jgi:drug/metabolite transporter (DMT)-like permease
MNHQKPGLTDYLLLHLCIIFWGGTAILGVFSSLASPYLVVYRTGLSFVTLFLILQISEKWSFPAIKDLKWMALAGLFTSLHWTTFFASAQMSNVSTCLAGMSTTALWTCLLEPVFSRKKFSKLELILALLVFSGLVIIYQSDLKMANGLAISTLSAFFCSLFTIFNRNLAQNHSPLLITSLEIGIAFVVSLLVLPFLFFMDFISAILPPAPAHWDWLNIAFLAWVCTVFAYTASVKLMKKFTAFAMNLTVNLEPVYGIMMGVLIFGNKEKMPLSFYLGLVLIFSGVFIYPVLENWKSRRSSKILSQPGE